MGKHITKCTWNEFLEHIEEMQYQFAVGEAEDLLQRVIKNRYGLIVNLPNGEKFLIAQLDSREIENSISESSEELNRFLSGFEV